MRDQCVIIGNDGLKGLADAFERLSAELNFPLKPVFWNMNALERSEIARPAHELVTTEAQDRLARTLADALIVVIDSSLPSLLVGYLTGAREALTDFLTYISYSNAKPDWPLFGFDLQFLSLDENQDARIRADLMRIAPQSSRPYQRRLEQKWTNGFRASRALKVSARPQILRRDGELLGRTNAASSPDKRVIEIYTADGADFSVGITFGNIADVRSFPVWINSENVDMQMGRVVDGSVSAQIRALGANWTGLDNQISEDDIYHELARELGVRSRVVIGDVLLTRVNPSTRLAKKNGVSLVAHVASVEPDGIGNGYRAAGNMAQCIKNALVEIEHSYGNRCKANTIDVLFPIFGAGDGGLGPAVAAGQMVSGLKSWSAGRSDVSKANVIKLPCFLARDYRSAEIIRAALAQGGFAHSGDEHWETPENKEARI